MISQTSSGTVERSVQSGHTWSEWVRNLPDVLTVEDVAAVLRIEESTVRNACRDGTMPGAFKQGAKLWRVKKSELLRDIERRAGVPEELHTPEDSADPNSH